MSDCAHKISFIQNEKWSFCNQRVTTEFDIIRSASGDLTYTIKSRGCEVSVEDVIENVGLNDRPLEEQVLTILTLLDHSNLCQGFHIEDDRTVIALVDHESGSFHDMQTFSTEDFGKEELRGFSSKCKVLSSGECCVSCQLLRDLDSERKERKRINKVMKPNCRKDYLTKNEIILQLESERRKRDNAESRERYWRDKFDFEAMEMDKNDHDDLSAIMLAISADENVPEDMKCLWEQQQKMLNSKKNGYRWHPK